MLERFLTSVEKAFVGETFAMNNGCSVRDRVWYWQTTGRWPQGQDSFFEQIIAQYDIDATTNPTCEQIKIDSANRIGLKVHPKKAF